MIIFRDRLKLDADDRLAIHICKVLTKENTDFIHASECFQLVLNLNLVFAHH